jgi:hypothetical protein
MWKKALAGTAALLIVGSSLVYAQADRGPDGWRWRPSAEDLSAFADARIAALHAGLKLTPDQEKNWPAFEQAYREFAKFRIARRMAWRDGPRADDRADNPVERWQRQAELLSTRGAALKKLADAAAPLYASLDDAQKRRFLALSRVGQAFGGFAAADGHFGMGRGGPDGGLGPHRFGERPGHGFYGHPGYEGRRGMMGPGPDPRWRGQRSDQDERL